MNESGDFKSDLFVTSVIEDDDESPEQQQELRRQYPRLGRQTFTEPDPTEKPITCFLHPRLTPAKLLEHLTRWGVSEAAIVHWLRRLQQVRGAHEAPADHVTTDHAYTVDMMGK